MDDIFGHEREKTKRTKAEEQMVKQIVEEREAIHRAELEEYKKTHAEKKTLDPYHEFMKSSKLEIDCEDSGSRYK